MPFCEPIARRVTVSAPTSRSMRHVADATGRLPSQIASTLVAATTPCARPSQLSKATQQNASASEELAATSEELSEQAEQLQATIAFFKIDEAGSSVHAIDGAVSKLKAKVDEKAAKTIKAAAKSARRGQMAEPQRKAA